MWRAQRKNLGVAGFSRLLFALVLAAIACNSDGTGVIEIAGLRFIAQPSNVGAGVPMNISVELIADDGSRVTGATDEVTITVNGGATLGGTTTADAVDGVATFSGVTLSTIGQNFQLTASAGDVSATSSTFSVVAGPATAAQSTMTVPANVVAGANASLSFVFRDALNNPISNAAVSFSTNLAGSTFTPASGTTDATGAFTTVFRATTSGQASITVNVAGLAITFPANIAVAPGASALRFVTPPASVAAGQTFTVAVEILDNAGQRLTSATNPITLTLSAGTLQGTATMNAVAGLATFPGLSINGAAAGTVLTATGAGLSLPSDPFAITAGAPSLAQSTANFAPALANGTASVGTFTFRDAFSNPIANAAVTLASTIAGTMFAPAAGNTNATGVFTSTITPGATGAGTITATIGGTPLVFNVTATGPCILGAPITIGTPLNATLSAASGCSLNNHPAAHHLVTLAAPAVLALTGTGVSAGFFPELTLTTDPPSTTGTVFFGQQTTPVVTRGPIEWLVPAGTFRAAISNSNGGGGDYTFTVANLGVGGAGCVPDRPEHSGLGRMLLGVNGTYTGQSFAATDCNDVDGEDIFYSDFYTIFDSRPCTVTMTSSVGLFFALLDVNFALASPTLVNGPLTGSISLPSCRTSAGPILVYASTVAPTTTGTYSLTVAFTGTGPGQSAGLRTMTVSPRDKASVSELRRIMRRSSN